ncbi:hypothetical protein [Cellulomonas sp. NPDC089187]|uniref:hypothetical protein n=1 Tax=Cellulomonas sp. NPDC089187 TaxID=3154970 RepID=UPI00341C5D25
MDEQQGRDDEAFARLRAADPAAAAQLDAAALRDRVDRRIAAVDASAPGTPGEDVLTLDPARRRRPTRWLQVAAAVAGVAVVAGGGYAVGRSGEGTVAAVPAISLAQGDGGGAATAESAVPGAQSMAADTRMFLGGRTVFAAGNGLTDDATTATAWTLDAASAVTEQNALRAAQLLGVDGAPQQQDGSWVVGATDGTGPSVTVYADGTAGLSYYDPTRDPWSCATADSADSADSVHSASPSSCATVQGSAPGGDQAVQILRDTLGGLGLDPESFQYGVPESSDPQSTSVSAELVLDGQATGVTWFATLVADGVQSLSGALATPVQLGSYDVVGARTAVERLGDPRFGLTMGGVMPLAREGVAVDDTTAVPQPASTVPPTVQPGAAIDWTVQQVTITEAELGLSQVFQDNGAVILAPSYLLTGDDGGTWGVIAVADSALAFG